MGDGADEVAGRTRGGVWRCRRKLAGSGDAASTDRMVSPAASAVLGLLVVLTGCASAPTERTLTARGTLELPMQVSAVRVAVVREASGFAAEAPDSVGERAAAATGSVGRLPPDVSTAVAAPVLIVTDAVAAVGSGAMGVVFGAGGGATGPEARAIAAATGEDTVAPRLARVIAQQLETRFTGVVRRGPDERARPEPPAGARRATARAPSAAPPDLTVRVRVLFRGLQVRMTARNDDLIRAAQAVNPPQVLLLAAQVEATRTDDGAWVGGVSVTYESIPRTFAQWAAGDARLLRTELVAAEEEIVQAVRERLLR